MKEKNKVLVAYAVQFDQVRLSKLVHAFEYERKFQSKQTIAFMEAKDWLTFLKLENNIKKDDTDTVREENSKLCDLLHYTHWEGVT